MDTSSAVSQMPMDFVNVTSVVITGVVVVFIGLILLVAIIYIFGSIMSKAKDAKKSEKAPSAPVKAAVSAPAPASNTAVSDDDEVIAVISAAVAAMSLSDGKTYAVRSIRAKSAGSANAWAGAARIENTRAF